MARSRNEAAAAATANSAVRNRKHSNTIERGRSEATGRNRNDIKIVPTNSYQKQKETIAISEYDPIIFFTVIILASFGLLMIFSSSYYISYDGGEGDMFQWVAKQAIAVCIGLFGILAAAVVNYNTWIKKSVPYVYIASLILLVLVRFIGREVNGAIRWIQIPVINFSIQPSEIAKIAVILTLSSFISDDIKRVRTLDGLIRCAVIILVPCLLVIWGKNLSTALIIAAIGFGLIFIASPHVWPFVVMGGLGVSGLVAYLTLSTGFRADRFAVWSNPWLDASGKGYQTIQSLYAVASGGLFGLGLGQSNQKLRYMPEPQNDFIFAIICEELGFFGAAFVLLIFSILIWRCIMVAINATNLFGTLIAAGAAIMIGVQVIINVAVVTNTLPNTGIPLPFISYGGTSVMFIMGLMGIVLNISRYSKKA